MWVFSGQWEKDIFLVEFEEPLSALFGLVRGSLRYFKMYVIWILGAGWCKHIYVNIYLKYVSWNQDVVRITSGNLNGAEIILWHWSSFIRIWCDFPEDLSIYIQVSWHWSRLLKKAFSRLDIPNHKITISRGRGENRWSHMVDWRCWEAIARMFTMASCRWLGVSQHRCSPFLLRYVGYMMLHVCTAHVSEVTIQRSPQWTIEDKRSSGVFFQNKVPPSLMFYHNFP